MFRETFLWQESENFFKGLSNLMNLHYFLISPSDILLNFFLCTYAEKYSVKFNIDKRTEDLIVRVRHGAIDTTNFYLNQDTYIFFYER